MALRALGRSQSGGPSASMPRRTPGRANATAASEGPHWAAWWEDRPPPNKCCAAAELPGMVSELPNLGRKSVFGHWTFSATGSGSGSGSVETRSPTTPGLPCLRRLASALSPLSNLARRNLDLPATRPNSSKCACDLLPRADGSSASRPFDPRLVRTNDAVLVSDRSHRAPFYWQI